MFLLLWGKDTLMVALPPDVEWLLPDVNVEIAYG